MPATAIRRTSPIRFSKWHGLGNDYLLIERRDAERALDAAAVRSLCDYHFGVGSDGILEVLSVEGDQAEILIWNPDGSTAELSGNGTRIAARWLAQRSASDEVVIAVGSRRVVAHMREAPMVETAMGETVVSPPETLDIDGERIEFTPVSIGNPHAVLRRDPDRSELLRLGPLLERHPRFPNRTNVQFVAIESPAAVRVAVWERGAGETLASGTSACAVVAAAIANGWCESPVVVHLQGGDLTVAIDQDFRATLTGPAEEICSGVVSGELLTKLGWANVS